jgi:hypothetical protein
MMMAVENLEATMARIRDELLATNKAAPAESNLSFLRTAAQQREAEDRGVSADQQIDESVAHAEEEGWQLARDLMATIERRNLGLAGRLAALSAVLRCVLSVPGGMPAAWNACQGAFERSRADHDG